MGRGLDRVIAGVSAIAVALTLPASVSAQEAPSRSDAPLAIRTVGGGGYLGVRISDVDASIVEDAGLAGEYGVHVNEVVADGPAAEAGLEDGDVIVRWNGERLESVAQLQRQVSETPAGRSVDLGVIRDGSQMALTVEIGERTLGFGGANVYTIPRGQTRLRGPDADELRARIADRVRVAPTLSGQLGFLGRPRLGVGLQSLGDQLAEYFDVEGGALVTSVNEDSPAEAAGLMAGDVIVSVDGEDVGDPGDVIRALADVESGPVDITYVRDGARRTTTAEVEEGENRWQQRSGEGSGAFYFNREGDEPMFFWNDGEGSFSLDPVSFEGLELEPMKWEGFKMDPMNFLFDLNDGEPIEITIPEIDIEGFEIPSIVVPSFDFNFALPTIIVDA